MQTGGSDGLRIGKIGDRREVLKIEVLLALESLRPEKSLFENDLSSAPADEE